MNEKLFQIKITYFFLLARISCTKAKKEWLTFSDLQFMGLSFCEVGDDDFAFTQLNKHIYKVIEKETCNIVIQGREAHEVQNLKFSYRRLGSNTHLDQMKY